MLVEISETASRVNSQLITRARMRREESGGRTFPRVAGEGERVTGDGWRVAGGGWRVKNIYENKIL